MVSYCVEDTFLSHTPVLTANKAMYVIKYPNLCNTERIVNKILNKYKTVLRVVFQVRCDNFIHFGIIIL